MKRRPVSRALPFSTLDVIAWHDVDPDVFEKSQDKRVVRLAEPGFVLFQRLLPNAFAQMFKLLHRD